MRQQPEQQFLFVASHACLDFVNTQVMEGGCLVDRLADFSDVLAWLVQAGLIDRREADRARRRWGGKPEGKETLRAAQALRDHLREMAERIVNGRPVQHELVDVLNAFLQRRRAFGHLVRRGKSFEIQGRIAVEKPADLLVPIAQSAAGLLCHADLSLVKRCQNPQCVLYFYDGTKNHRRRWCSMSLCGNRMKVAAHYRRKRQHR